MHDPFATSQRRRRSNIAVFRALQLGDMLCAVPALRALRKAHPRSRITLIGLPWAREFACRFRHLVDDFLAFPGYPGMPEQACEPADVIGFLERAHACRFDLAIQMHGNGRIANVVTQLLGAAHSAGYFLPGDYRPDNGSFFAWKEGEHEVVRWLRLLVMINAAPHGMHLEFPLAPDDFDAFDALAGTHALEEGRYVCVHPGSQLPSRRWPAKRFAAVADDLAAAGYMPVITGTIAERTLAQSVADAMRAPAQVLAGETTLGALAVLIGRAAGLVCNDTGVSHIAAAMRTPSAIVSCGSDPARWAPLDHALHRMLAAPAVCRPCMHRLCPIEHPCATGTSVEQVSAVMRQLLAEREAACRPRRPAIARQGASFAGGRA